VCGDTGPAAGAYHIAIIPHVVWQTAGWQSLRQHWIPVN
jgi:hypothetical protein